MKNKSNILNLLFGGILVILVAIIIYLVWPTGKQNTNFDSNLRTMLNYAKSYFNNKNLPEKVGESTMLTYDQIHGLEDDTCDSKASYVTATKTMDGNYALKVKLVCGDKSQVLVDTIEGVIDNNQNENNKPNDNTNDKPNNNGSNNGNNSNINNNNQNNNNQGNNNQNNNQNNGSNVKPSVTKYTVKFNSDGGTSVASQTVVKGNKVIKPANPTKSGYAFNGWYLNNKLYNFNSSVNGNITLVAKWIKNSSEKKFYYEQAPVEKIYTSDWSLYYPTNAAFFETKKEVATVEERYKPGWEYIYSVAYITKEGYDAYKDKYGKYEFDYTIELKNFDAYDEFMFGKDSLTKFNGRTYYQEYLDNRKNIGIYNSTSAKSVNATASQMSSAALRTNDYDFEVSKPYVKGGKVLVDITVTVNRISNDHPYELYNGNDPIYFIGIKFRATKAYKTERYLAVKNSFDYPSSWTGAIIGEELYTKEVTLYRPYHYNVNNTKTIWTTEASVSGYQPTGRTKWE